MAENIPYGTTEPIHRFVTDEPGKVIVENLPTRDLRALIGPNGLSTYVPVVEGNQVMSVKKYAVEGMTSVDTSSDVPEGSIVISVSSDEAAQHVVRWVHNSLHDVYQTRHRF